MSAAPATWTLANNRSIRLDGPRLLAVINATPDSFSDGGAHLDPAAALARAREAVAEGADALDIGGESTRPGAAPVPPAEQARRILPIIRAIRAAGIAVPISVDTTSADVARGALDAGADAVNDVSGATDDPRMLALCAERRCGLILMHRLRPPASDSWSHAYTAEPDYSASGGVVNAVRGFLAGRAEAAAGAGIAPGAIVLDPGLGFGKSVAQNFELIRATPEFCSLGFPVLGAASRKSFIGRASGVGEPALRAEGSLAASVAQFLAGARLFRVHDVAPHRRALAVAAAVAGLPGPAE